MIEMFAVGCFVGLLGGYMLAKRPVNYPLIRNGSIGYCDGEAVKITYICKIRPVDLHVLWMDSKKAEKVSPWWWKRNVTKPSADSMHLIAKHMEAK